MAPRFEPPLDVAKIVPLGQQDWSAGLNLLLSDLPETARQQRIASILAAASQPPQFFAGLLGVLRAERLAGVIWVELLAGRCAAVWSPRLAAGEPAETAQMLLATAGDLCRAAGCRIAQALPATSTEAAIFIAGDFQRLAELCYLFWASNSACPDKSLDVLADCVQFHAYDDARAGEFAQVVQQTYSGTLDCPAFSGLRPIDEVLESYRAGGAIDPQHWLLALEGQQIVGCLILADYPAHDQFELVYMGLLPAARGRSLGRSLVAHAQRMTQRARRARITLSVDSQNHPAAATYAERGFTECDRRPIYFRLFEPPGDVPSDVTSPH